MPTSSSSTVSYLPVELWEMIFAHLSNDGKILKTCSLVCRSWLSPCRFHLFSSISVPAHAASMFTQLLRSPHSTFSAHFKNLALQDWKSGVTVEEVLSEVIQAKVTVHTLNLCLNPKRVPKAPNSVSTLNVRRLELKLATPMLYTDPLTILFPPWNTQENVTQAQQDEWLAHIRDFLSPFHAASSMESLDIRTTTDVVFNEQFISSLAPPPTSLRDISIWGCKDSARLLEWYLCPEHGLNIRRLGRIDVPFASYFQDYMSHRGQTVEELDIGSGTQGLSTIINLIFPATSTFLLPNLGVLQLTMMCGVFDSEDDLPLLERVRKRCPNLQQLCFRARYPTYVRLNVAEVKSTLGLEFQRVVQPRRPGTVQNAKERMTLGRRDALGWPLGDDDSLIMYGVAQH